MFLSDESASHPSGMPYYNKTAYTYTVRTVMIFTGRNPNKTKEKRNELLDRK